MRAESCPSQRVVATVKLSWPRLCNRKSTRTVSPGAYTSLSVRIVSSAFGGVNKAIATRVCSIKLLYQQLGASRPFRHDDIVAQPRRTVSSWRPLGQVHPNRE